MKNFFFYFNISDDEIEKDPVKKATNSNLVKAQQQTQDKTITIEFERRVSTLTIGDSSDDQENELEHRSEPTVSNPKTTKSSLTVTKMKQKQVRFDDFIF